MLAALAVLAVLAALGGAVGIPVGAGAPVKALGLDPSQPLRTAAH